MHELIIILFKPNKSQLNLNDTVYGHYFIALTKIILHHDNILFNNTIYQQSIGLL